jgi:RNA polymerase sigma-70 factor (ECF subfamily)
MDSQPSPLIELLSNNDQELARLAVRDGAAFAELYHRHFLRVYRYLIAACGNTADAQDLTTQTFMAALEGISSFRGESSFLSWLLGIARNKTALHFRSHRREVSIESIGELNDPSPSPEILAGKRLELEQVSRALHKLVPERAEAIRLYLFADLSAAETAQAMKKSPAAVKMLVLRGLRDLRRQLLPLQEIDR